MTKKRLGVLSLSCIFLMIAVVFFSGCETLKGAASGFKRDWQKLTNWDKEFQEVFW